MFVPLLGLCGLWLPVLLFRWDTEKFSTPGVWWSGAEKKKKRQEDISTICKSKANVLGILEEKLLLRSLPVRLALRR